MTDLISASPLIVLIGLAVLAWFLDSRILKLATAGVFFLYPVIIGNVHLPTDLSQIPNFLGNVIKYWFTNALNDLIKYLKQHLFGG